jgi:hypothetical protein
LFLPCHTLIFDKFEVWFVGQRDNAYREVDAEMPCSRIQHNGAAGSENHDLTKA